MVEVVREEDEDEEVGECGRGIEERGRGAVGNKQSVGYVPLGWGRDWEVTQAWFECPGPWGASQSTGTRWKGVLFTAVHEEGKEGKRHEAGAPTPSRLPLT